MRAYYKHRTTGHRLHSALTLSTVLLASCRSAEAPKPPAEAAQVVFATAPTSIFLRGDYRLSVAVDGRAPRPGEVQWGSSDPAVASVDENGVVFGNRLGAATITATVHDVKASVTLNVVPVSIELIPGTTSLLLEVGNTLQVDALIKDASGRLEVPITPVLWQLSDPAPLGLSTPDPATSSSVVLKAVQGGITRLRASASGAERTILVRVFPGTIREAPIDATELRVPYYSFWDGAYAPMLQLRSREPNAFVYRIDFETEAGRSSACTFFEVPTAARLEVFDFQPYIFYWKGPAPGVNRMVRATIYGVSPTGKFSTTVSGFIFTPPAAAVFDFGEVLQPGWTTCPQT